MMSDAVGSLFSYNCFKCCHLHKNFEVYVLVYVRCMRPILRVYAEVYANAVHLTRFLFPSVRTP